VKAFRTANRGSWFLASEIAIDRPHLGNPVVERAISAMTPGDDQIPKVRLLDYGQPSRPLDQGSAIHRLDDNFDECADVTSQLGYQVVVVIED
jgi:hypothetical protein